MVMCLLKADNAVVAWDLSTYRIHRIVYRPFGVTRNDIADAWSYLQVLLLRFWNTNLTAYAKEWLVIMEEKILMLLMLHFAIVSASNTCNHSCLSMNNIMLILYQKMFWLHSLIRDKHCRMYNLPTINYFLANAVF